MNRVKLTLLTAILIATAFTFLACEEKGEKAELAGKPPAINLFQYSKSESRGPLYPTSLARMWGWSNNGKVAYSIDAFQDGRGGHVIYFVILNLASGKAEFELEMDTEDHGEDADVESVYNFNQAKISNALKEHKIVRKNAQFLPFPFTSKRLEYKAKIIDVEYKKAETEGIFLDEHVSKYAVLVGTDDHEEVIGKFSPVSSFTGYVYICGYFLSPFEDRAMVVVAEEHWGFEGTDLTYRFINLNLKDFN